MSFGLAFGSLITGWYLNGMPQSDRLQLTGAIHHAFITLGVITMLSSLTFWTLRREDGESISKAKITGSDGKTVDALKVADVKTEDLRT